ncbi:flagellar protein FlaG [Oceanisphaera sp. KMM 10153]|uniref:flagellar protein FlaG n=1 Tax=Oceanisphaera submarina TaxID=3390193 RepID=UPI003975B154
MMDTLPLSPKAPVLASDMGTIQQATTTKPVGREATQTVQAVQALDKTDANSASVTEQTAQNLTAEQLADMAEQMDKFVGSFTHELKFRVDEDSGRNVVTVIDSQSGDTIRQIPTEELLDVIARLAEASGGLIDVKA